MSKEASYMSNTDLAAYCSQQKSIENDQLQRRAAQCQLQQEKIQLEQKRQSSWLSLTVEERDQKLTYLVEHKAIQNLIDGGVKRLRQYAWDAQRWARRDINISLFGVEIIKTQVGGNPINIERATVLALFLENIKQALHHAPSLQKFENNVLKALYDNQPVKMTSGNYSKLWSQLFQEFISHDGHFIKAQVNDYLQKEMRLPQVLAELITEYLAVNSFHGLNVDSAPPEFRI